MRPEGEGPTVGRRFLRRRSAAVRGLALAASAALLGLARALPAGAVTVADLATTRCACNYLFGEDTEDVGTWERDLDAIKLAGLNTVWMVNVWAAYQPSVEPSEWQEERVEALRRICAAARERQMNLLLVLAYIGEGWGPKGVDVPVWPLIDRHRREHLDFLRRMARETRDFDNVFYLLCSEEILPATLLYRPNEREECVASFRAWARQANPDVGYWNQRWGTEYTWENLAPADTKHRPRWQLWADHSRWHGYLLRGLLPPMVAVIREEKPGALVGYHDFLMPEKTLGLTAADGGLEPSAGCDFYSIGCYRNPKAEGGLEGHLAALRGQVEKARDLYPGVPLFVGELGMAVRKAPPETRREEEAMQADFLRGAVEYLEGEGLGFSLWAWRTVVPGAEETHSLVREDGSMTPALEGLKEHWGR